MSPPLRRSGLKFNNYVDFVDEEIVSALAAEWIEMTCEHGKWSGYLSPPSRRSGLKLGQQVYTGYGDAVSALAAEWIEMYPSTRRWFDRGNVSALAAEWIEISAAHPPQIPLP